MSGQISYGVERHRGALRRRPGALAAGGGAPDRRRTRRRAARGPPHAGVDRSALEALRAGKVISDYQLGDRTLLLYLDRLEGETALRYLLVGGRAGRCELEPTRIRPLLEPERARSAGAPTILEVK